MPGGADVMRLSVRAPLELLRAGLPLIALIGAMWPVWQWLAARAASDTSDAWALVSLVTAIALMWRDRASVHERLASRATTHGEAPLADGAPVHGGVAVRWGLAAVLMLLYAA